MQVGDFLKKITAVKIFNFEKKKTLGKILTGEKESLGKTFVREELKSLFPEYLSNKVLWKDQSNCTKRWNRNGPMETVH